MPQQGVTDTQYFSGQGVFMIGTRTSTGGPAGLRPVGTVRDLTMSVTTNEITEKETQTGARGVELTLTTEVGVSIAANLKSLDKDNLELATLGANTDLTSGTVTDKPVTLSGELYMPLGYVNVSSVVVTDPTGATTYVENTDYLLDAQSGLLSRIAAGSIPDGEETLVDFAYAVQSHIEGSITSSSPDYWVRFNGLNTADGDKPVVLDFFKVSAKPLKNLALITDTTAGLELDFNVLYDSLRPAGKSNYYRILKY